MFEVPEVTEQCVYYVRRWPLADHDRALLQQSALQQQVILILTENALTHLWQTPDDLLQFPYTCYAIQTEIQALRATEDDLTELPFPAFVMQLNDASWVELTLQSQLVTHFA
ncbi:hypothetical protein ACQ5ES_02235 [Pseudidiomarina sp. E22-M8]|uniref:hypothetical protein n=1 Tax=Pseudidiomarina sp. E22-M8 TaxID=3424768 RepID=UPI00403CED43